MKALALQRTCDIDQAVPAETMKFSYGGKNYTLDLCSQHRKQYDDHLGKYAEVATEVRRSGRPSKNGKD